MSAGAKIDYLILLSLWAVM